MDRLLDDYKRQLEQSKSPMEVVRLATIFNGIAAQFLKEKFHASERAVANHFSISNTTVSNWIRKSRESLKKEEDGREHLS